jgi:hypothetical protein
MSAKPTYLIVQLNRSFWTSLLTVFQLNCSVWSGLLTVCYLNFSVRATGLLDLWSFELLCLHKRPTWLFSWTALSGPAYWRFVSWTALSRSASWLFVSWIPLSARPACWIFGQLKCSLCVTVLSFEVLIKQQNFFRVNYIPRYSNIYSSTWTFVRIFLSVLYSIPQYPYTYPINLDIVIILYITIRGFWLYWLEQKRWAVRKQLGLSSACMLGNEWGNRNGFYDWLSQQEWSINEIEFEVAGDLNIMVTVAGIVRCIRDKISVPLRLFLLLYFCHYILCFMLKEKINPTFVNTYWLAFLLMSAKSRTRSSHRKLARMWEALRDSSQSL